MNGPRTATGITRASGASGGWSWDIPLGARRSLLGPATWFGTILEASAGLRGGADGQISWAGQATKLPGPSCVFVSAEPGQLIPWKTVIENVVFPLKLLGKETPMDEARRWLGRFRVSSGYSTYPSGLSREEATRVVLARAFALGPPRMVLQDPFAHLSGGAREELLDLVAKLQEEKGLSLLLGTEDPDTAVRLGQQVAVRGSPEPEVFATSLAERELLLQYLRGRSRGGHSEA